MWYLHISTPYSNDLPICEANLPATQVRWVPNTLSSVKVTEFPNDRSTCVCAAKCITVSISSSATHLLHIYTYLYSLYIMSLHLGAHIKTICGHNPRVLLLDHVVQKVWAFDVTLHELEVRLPWKQNGQHPVGTNYWIVFRFLARPSFPAIESKFLVLAQ